MSNDLTIIMYHYVRQLELSKYPDIKARSILEFRFQIEYIKKNYYPVTMHDVVSCVRSAEPLPPKAVLLTFDDGYIDHFINVFPILFDEGIQGAFFPPTAAVCRSELLEVNRIHFILANEKNHEILGRFLDEEIRTYGLDYCLKTPESYRLEWAKSNNFDDAETVYVKRMLQFVLPESLRINIGQKLFAKYVSIDEIDFASELYCTKDQLKLMQASGMYVGSHGESHYWLNSVDEKTQRKEVENSIDFLREIESPVDDYWVMCYPYGAWNQSLLSILREYKCSIGLTSSNGRANIGINDPLLLPRLDTNDILFKDNRI